MAKEQPKVGTTPGATPGATRGATPGATPRQPPANGGATYSPYTPRRCTPARAGCTPASDAAIASVPTYDAAPCGSTQMRFRCPVCWAVHRHGRADLMPGETAHYLAHCTDPASHPRGYWLRLLDGGAVR